MIISIGTDGLRNLVTKQLENNFLLTNEEKSQLLQAIPDSLLKSERCFKETTNKYYWSDKKGLNELQFNPFHSGQYTMFLYFLSQIAWKHGGILLADKIYYLNKMLNCCDLFYQIELPEIFFVEHPVGSVMGRGSYSNYFSFGQDCTVGENNGIYPSFGELVRLYPNSIVVGNSKIGNNVFISAGAIVKDEVIPDNTMVFGKSPNLIIKSKPSEYFYKKSPFKVHKNMF